MGCSNRRIIEVFGSKGYRSRRKVRSCPGLDPDLGQRPRILLQPGQGVGHIGWFGRHGEISVYIFERRLKAIQPALEFLEPIPRNDDIVIVESVRLGELPSQIRLLLATVPTESSRPSGPRILGHGPTAPATPTDLDDPGTLGRSAGGLGPVGITIG